MKAEGESQKGKVTERRGVFRFSFRLLILYFIFLLFTSTALAQLVKSVDTVGMTVSDMDRSVEFFSKVLSFEKFSDIEVVGSEYERLQGLFGVRMRIVRMRLGDEIIELTEYLAPKGRPIPADSRSNDQWFQHIAIVVSDMDKAYSSSERIKFSTPPPARSGFPIGTRPRPASRLSISRLRTATISSSSISRQVKVTRSGNRPTAVFFWVSIIRRLRCRTRTAAYCSTEIFWA
jgi:hypothetical protein